ncbi:MAG TPA: hypothetical protein VFR73_22250 [Hyphomicrobiaceae bacterium]|nr:hypothetical protein [Hyphomicrobiaceae bacterium]
MGRKILILGASYGSLLGTKLVMAGHSVTLVCRASTAELINSAGTEVRVRLKGEPLHRSIHSNTLPGRLDARTPECVEPRGYDLVVLAMQEPQYVSHTVRALVMAIAEARLPCLSLMNMPPLPYLKRIAAIDVTCTELAFTEARIWDRFDPQLMSLCSPDPQAFRPQGEPANVLNVGLPSNFKAAAFGLPAHTEMLTELADSIDAVRLDGLDVPVKLRVHDSLFVPLSKWPMLLTGNYRSVHSEQPISIRDAVHGDLRLSRETYATVRAIVLGLGAAMQDLVPFDKYAAAANELTRPSSVARAIAAGTPFVERVDKLVQLLGRKLSLGHPEIDATVARVDHLIGGNRACAA